MSYKGNIVIVGANGPSDEDSINIGKLFKSSNRAILVKPNSIEIVYSQPDLQKKEAPFVLVFDPSNMGAISDVWEVNDFYIAKCGEQSFFGSKTSETLYETKRLVVCSKNSKDLEAILKHICSYEKQICFLVVCKKTGLLYKFGEWHSDVLAREQTVKPIQVYQSTTYAPSNYYGKSPYQGSASQTQSPPQLKNIKIDGLEICLIEPGFRSCANIPSNYLLYVNEISPESCHFDFLEQDTIYLVNTICGTAPYNGAFALQQIKKLLDERRHGHLHLIPLNRDLEIVLSDSISISVNTSNKANK